MELKSETAQFQGRTLDRFLFSTGEWFVFLKKRKPYSRDPVLCQPVGAVKTQAEAGENTMTYAALNY